jgi:hypothetical protein
MKDGAVLAAAVPVRRPFCQVLALRFGLERGSQELELEVDSLAPGLDTDTQQASAVVEEQRTDSKQMQTVGAGLHMEVGRLVRASNILNQLPVFGQLKRKTLTATSYPPLY